MTSEEAFGKCVIVLAPYLQGSAIDGSTFNINIVVMDDAGGLTYYGTTTATLEFTVNPDGNLEITITDVNGVVQE